MKWMHVLLCSLGALSGPVLADSCWIVTDLKGKAAYASDDYAVTDDKIGKTVFWINISEHSPSIAVNGAIASYGDGELMKINENTLLYAYPSSQSVIETWSIDERAGKAYMTQSRSGVGGRNKASFYIGSAKTGCSAT
ncbi:hypothetical protein BFW91_00990 [Pseudomonas fluorescens]|uniref:hypothetical protein n=1 Tax=Pseudomonas fluorescens TaxID=294 RepID=UPI00099B86D5|nr:hypothetical protein [Pseudomonas fluorescens]OPB16692.1 hypothetical protein BFW91_00990 [Pseudomonas fluorescens]